MQPSLRGTRALRVTAAALQRFCRLSVLDEMKLKTEFNPSDDMIQVKIGASDGVGLPVGVQCVALPFQEEMCLRAMREVEKALKKFP